MMLKKLMNNGAAVLVAAGALSLAACGQNGSGNGGGNASATPAGGSDQSQVENAADNAASTVANAAKGATDSLKINDSSAEGAIFSYINNLKAGDFLKAAEVCLPDAPGTGELVKLGENFAKMQSEPENASLGATAKALMVDEFKTIEVNKMVEEDGVVIYEVAVINKSSVNVRVEQRDGVWRVIPPTSGTPLG